MEDKIIIVPERGDEPRIRLSDCIKFGFGFYIGFNLGRVLKRVVIAMNISK